METWRDIKGYEGFYQVSSEGRIRSLDIVIERRDGKKYPKKGQIMKPEKNRQGYLLIGFRKKGEHVRKTVHKLVWEAFNGTVPEGMQVNHINEDKTDNRLCNLNLMTPKENSNWGTRTERIAKAMSKPVYCYNKDGSLACVFQSCTEAGRNGYRTTSVSACARGKLKTHKGLIWTYEKR